MPARRALGADAFIRSDEERLEPDALAKITTHLRNDRNLTPEAATALDQLIKSTYARLTERE